MFVSAECMFDRVCQCIVNLCLCLSTQSACLVVFVNAERMSGCVCQCKVHASCVCLQGGC